MVNWLFKISYTPVGPETYSSRPFMHKIPLCETLSKCVMIGVSPEVCPQGLSVETASQFPFLKSVSMRLSLSCGLTQATRRPTLKIHSTLVLLKKELVFFNLQRCYLIQHLAVWHRVWARSCSKILKGTGGRFVWKDLDCPRNHKLTISYSHTVIVIPPPWPWPLMKGDRLRQE